MEKYMQIKDGVLETYTGREETLVVPVGVHTIGTGACKACISLKKVVLPPGLLRIGDDAFKGCRKLEEIEIPEGVTTIGSYAFHRCHALRQICLPGSVEEVGDCAFLYCDHLVEARLPGVKRLGAQMFLNDVRLQTIELSAELEAESICDMFTGCSRITEIILTEIILTKYSPAETFPTEISTAGNSRFVRECVRIPNAVEAAASGQALPALARQVVTDILKMMELDGRRLVRFLINLKHVEIPEGVQSLAKSCFFDKRGIVSVTLPASLKEIESRAFRNCISLERVEFQGDEVEIREDAFRNCTSLKIIRLGNGQEYQLEGLTGVTKLSRGQKVEQETDVERKTSVEQETNIEQATKQKTEQTNQANQGAEKETTQGNPIPGIIRQIQKQVLGNFRLSGTILLNYLGAESRVVVPEGITRIGAEAFAGNEAIDRVILPESLIEIGAEAFRDCLLLQSITFPEGMTRIGTGAFERCVKLLRVSFPEKIKTLEARTFRHCQALHEVTFPEGLQEIGEGAFYGCISLKKLVFPEQITTIGELAFYRCDSLKEVRLPAAAEQVQSLAFARSGVRRVRIAGSGFSFGKDVFGSCPNLKTLCLEEGVRHVPDKLAYGCTALEKVTVPETLESVGRYALEGSVFLKHWRAEGRPCLGKDSGIFWEKEDLDEPGVNMETRAVLEMTNIEPLPLYADGICYGDPTIKELYLPEGITEIAPYAFAGNRALESVFLPDSVKKIGEGAFWGCSGLRKIRFPAAVKEKGKEERKEEGECSSYQIEARAFEKCSSLVELETDAEQIGVGAFSFCTALRRIVLPGITRISANLLEGCKSLIECLCERVEAIEKMAFCGCESLKSFSFSRIRQIGSYAFESCNSLKEAAFGEEIYLEPYAFRDCGRLSQVALGEKMSLLEYAFSGCTAIQTVRYQEKNWNFSGYSDICLETIPEAVRRIWDSAFSCFLVEQKERICAYRGAGKILHIPEGIRRIEAEVFRNCIPLQEVTFPESLKYIGARAFHGTNWLEQQTGMIVVKDMLLDASSCQGEVVIPAEIRLVCGWAFANGLNIKKIRFLSERTRVGEYAFRNCVFLEEILLPDGNCVPMEGLSDREKELPPLAKQAALDSMNCFKTNDDRELVECTGNISVLRLANGITAIGEGAFQDGNLLTRIFFAGSVQRIGKRAFAGCKWLEEVLCAEEVQEIGEQAFSGCGRLRKIELSDKLCRIGARAFEHCTALEEIRIPEGVVEIPEKAFYRCHSLKKLVLPSTIERIGKDAFAFCGWEGEFKSTKAFLRRTEQAEEAEKSGQAGQKEATERSSR